MLQEIDATPTHSPVHEGVYRDVTAQARKAGFRAPCRFTPRAYALAVRWPINDPRGDGEQARLTACLDIAFAKAADPDAPRGRSAAFHVPAQPGTMAYDMLPYRGYQPLVLRLGQDSEGAPRLTVTLPDED